MDTSAENTAWSGIVIVEKTEVTSRRPFNYDEFMMRYRIACEQRGIDPVVGANGYQVVHITAEQRRRSWHPSRWWRQHELWLNCPPYRSETEQEALWQVFVEAYGATARRFVQALRLRRAQAAMFDLRQHAGGK